MIIKQQQADMTIKVYVQVGGRRLDLTRSGALPADTDFAGFSEEIKAAVLIPYVDPEAAGE